MRYLGAVALAAVSALTASSALASQPLQRQVLIQARIAEVSSEFRAGLGVDWTATGGSYRSTSNEPPGSGTANLLNGVGTVGATLWFNTGAMAPAPGDPNGLNLGLGVDASGSFGGDDDILRLSRHNNNDIVDTVLSRTINYTIDVMARASIPVVISAPRIISTDSNKAVIFIEPSIGASVIGSETELMSNRTGIGGPNLVTRKAETQVGFVGGIGLSTEIGKIPFLGDIPILAGLFYKARNVPSTSAGVTANGVTETGTADSSWEHEALLIFVTPFIVRHDEK